jgi:hypothetical protein
MEEELMTPYVARHLTALDIEIFQKVHKLVEGLPDDIDLGSDDRGEKIVLSCHILVRALAKVLNLRYRDGYYHPNYRHSWLLTSDSQIIDAYPVATWGGPFMIDGNDERYTPARWLYLPKSTRVISGGSFSRPWFRRAVRRITRALKGIEGQCSG